MNHKFLIVKTYIYWAFLVGVTFFSIYPLCNWITSKRSDVLHIYFDNELLIPLVPEFIWVYLSLYVVFFLPPFFLSVLQLEKLGKEIILGTILSAVIYLLFPMTLGFERIVPEVQYKILFQNIFFLDLPYNMAPSLHIVYSGFILVSIFKVLISVLLKTLIVIWFVLICFSTLLVHQHHIIDIILGLIVVLLLNYIVKMGK